MAIWRDGRWETVFDQRTADWPITGTRGANKEVGIHPDILANQRCAELDREAAVIEEAGRNSGVPPSPAKEGDPSGAGDYYSAYLRRS